MNARVNDLRAELAEKYGRLFASPDGKSLVEMLERRFFNGDLLGKTPEETAFNLGAREVVRVMRDLRALVEKKEKSNG